MTKMSKPVLLVGSLVVIVLILLTCILRRMFQHNGTSVEMWILMVFVGGMLFAVVFWLFSIKAFSSMSDSVTGLRESIRSIARVASLSERVSGGQGDEVETLADEINSMLRSLESAQKEAEQHRQEVVQAQKMATLGTLISGVAHEVNNPNNIINLNATLFSEFFGNISRILEDKYAQDPDFRLGNRKYADIRDDLPLLLKGIRESSSRISGIISDMKSFAQPDDGVRMEPVDVNAVVESAARLLKHELGVATSRFAVSCAPDLPAIQGSFRRLEQVMVNLLQNACQALSARDQAIKVETGFLPDGNAVTIKVVDGGRGIPRENMSRITQPFFTTRRDEGGMGLGLSLSRRIVEEHGGTIKFESVEGSGTTVLLTMPVERRDIRES